MSSSKTFPSRYHSTPQALSNRVLEDKAGREPSQEREKDTVQIEGESWREGAREGRGAMWGAREEGEGESEIWGERER